MKRLFPTTILVGLFAILSTYTLVQAIRAPIYPDEIAFLRLNGSVFQDERTVTALVPVCRAAQNLELPAALYPGAAIYGVLYGLSSFTYFRLVGLGIFGSILLLIYALLGHLPRSHRVLATMAAMAIMLLGVQPYFILFTRPEMLMIALLGLGLLTSTREPTRSPSAIGRVGWIALGVSAVSLFYHLHPKSIFFAPLVFGVLWIGKRDRLTGFTLVAFNVLAFVQTTRLFFRKLNCTELQNVGDSYWRQYVDPFSLLRTPAATALEMATNVGNGTRYFVNILFNESYGIDWLPAHPSSGWIALTLNAAILFTFATLCFGILALLFTFRREKRGFILALLAFTLVGVSALQIAKNFYEASLVVPFLLLSIAFARPTGIRTITLASIFALLVSIASQLTLWHRYPLDTREARPGPNLNQSDYARVIATGDIEKAARACGMPNVRVVVDDMTYLPLRSVRHSMFVTYLLSALDLRKQDAKSFLSTLREVEATAVITRCASLPALVHPLAISYGEICCLPAQVIGGSGS